MNWPLMGSYFEPGSYLNRKSALVLPYLHISKLILFSSLIPKHPNTPHGDLNNCWKNTTCLRKYATKTKHNSVQLLKIIISGLLLNLLNMPYTDSMQKYLVILNTFTYISTIYQFWFFESKFYRKLILSPLAPSIFKENT